MLEARATIKDALRAARLVQEAVGRGAGGRELALTITKLEEALMWCDQAESVYRRALEA